jgi:hypothetical protein
MYMIYYIIFVITLTLVVLSETYAPGKCNGNSEQSIAWFILLVLTVILVVRELMQFCLLPKKRRYFCNLDYLLEVCIIGTTISILAGYCPKLIAAATLLLAWMEIMLQLGCINCVAVYNEMMKRVTLNYVKVLLWCSPLILAFSFSFYNIYHNANPSEGKNGTFHINSTSGNFSVQEDDVDFYRSIPLSLIKTVVMMIGEFDASTMSFDIGSYFVFLFFVFMMTIVLMNLLNGLAVSDTQAIRKDAELVAHRSRVKLVHQFESVVFRCPLRCQWLQKLISLFPDKLQNGKLVVSFKHETRYTKSEMEESVSDVEFIPDTRFNVCKYRKGSHVRKVLIAAKDIAVGREQQSQHENKQIANMIAKMEENLQGYKEQLENLKGLLIQ